jgi:serine/threonine protein phosphatase 1
LAENSLKKIFVVSDIHGHYSILAEALEKAGFDKDHEDHLLVCCGDYFDRGNENMEVLKFFERLKHKVLLRGNHEDMLLKLLKTGRLLPHHYINGTMSTLNNIFGKYSVNPVDDSIDFSGKTRITDRLCEFIEETVDYYETERYVFVHGWLPENAVTAQDCRQRPRRSWEQARWVKWTEKYSGHPPLEDKTLICGHMPTFFAPNRAQNDADIFYGNGLIAIDAGTTDSKQINVLVLEDRLIEN